MDSLVHKINTKQTLAIFRISAQFLYYQHFMSRKITLKLFFCPYHSYFLPLCTIFFKLQDGKIETKLTIFIQDSPLIN